MGVVLPNTTFHRNWDYLMLLLLVYTAFVTPAEVAFSSEVSINGLFFVNRDALFSHHEASESFLFKMM